MRFTLVRPGKMDPVVLTYKDGTAILFSYEQPVAAFVPGRGYIAVESGAVSPTTLGRINQWIKDHEYEEVPYSAVLQVIIDRPIYQGD